MKKLMVLFVSFCALIMFLFTLGAGKEPVENIYTTLAGFDWLVGHWRGEGLGGVCEETWLPESGGIMLGTFKLINNDKVSFYEIMSLTIDSLGPAVRVKHFNADMTGWEDKAEMVTFRYDSTHAGEIFFGGLRFSKPADDSLRIGITFKKKDGSTREEFINCKKIELK